MSTSCISLKTASREHCEYRLGWRQTFLTSIAFSNLLRPSSIAPRRCLLRNNEDSSGEELSSSEAAYRANLSLLRLLVAALHARDYWLCDARYWAASACSCSVGGRKPPWLLIKTIQEDWKKTSISGCLSPLTSANLSVTGALSAPGPKSCGPRSMRACEASPPGNSIISIFP